MFLMRTLTELDAAALAAFLQRQPAEYMAYFTPFSFDELEIAKMLQAAQADLYIGVFWQDELAGFLMLRGWDAGYRIPAYGVVIDQASRGLGLGRLTLDAAKTICRLRHADKLMLKVHPENRAAKHLYESAGFVRVSTDPRNGNLVYHCTLT